MKTKTKLLKGIINVYATGLWRTMKKNRVEVINSDCQKFTLEELEMFLKINKQEEKKDEDLGLGNRLGTRSKAGEEKLQTKMSVDADNHLPAKKTIKQKRALENLK